VAKAVPIEAELPSDMQIAVENLKKLNDKDLWKAARSHLPAKSAKKIADLHLKREVQDLTPPEKQLLSELMNQYEKSILIRAEATALLMERGYDVSVLIQKKR
jgi:hypothetical protein